MHSKSWIPVIHSMSSSVMNAQSRWNNTGAHATESEPTKRKPKPKHPLKVHVWLGISRHGATNVCIFDGIMDAELYCRILETTLLPFINQTLPGHRFMKENDPKHTSRRAQAFMEENGINWWRTPPESPDLNRIENLWHELRLY